MSYWELNEQQRRSFAGRVFRFGSINGSQTLYSFSDNLGRPKKPDVGRHGKYDPMYWMTESNLLDAVRRSLQRPSDVFEYIRQGVALCEDWTSMNYMFTLEVPSSFQVEAWYGLAKSQSRLSQNNVYGAKVDSVLTGGWMQYIIDPTNGPNGLLHWIRGPIKTGR